MTAFAGRTFCLTIIFTKPRWRIGKIAEALAALLASGLLVLNAVPPNETSTSAARAAGINAGLSEIAGRETTFGAYLGAPYHYPSDFHLRKAGRHDLKIGRASCRERV